MYSPENKKELPDLDKPFRVHNDLSILKIDKSYSSYIMYVWMRHEKFWNSHLKIRDEDGAWASLRSSEWEYLFRYVDTEFKAKNIDAAMTSFLDNAWGNHYVKYLEKIGFKDMPIGAIDSTEDTEGEFYYCLTQKLENGAILKTEIWLNDDDTYYGSSYEIVE